MIAYLAQSHTGEQLIHNFTSIGYGGSGRKSLFSEGVLVLQSLSFLLFIESVFEELSFLSFC